MKLFVLHDASGTIVSVAAASEQAEGQAELIAGDGQLLAVIDAQTLRLPAAREGHRPDLAELGAHLVAHHRVEHGRLAPRAADAPADGVVRPDGMIAAFGAAPDAPADGAVQPDGMIAAFGAAPKSAPES